MFNETTLELLWNEQRNKLSYVNLRNKNALFVSDVMLIICPVNLLCSTKLIYWLQTAIVLLLMLSNKKKFLYCFIWESDELMI